MMLQLSVHLSGISVIHFCLYLHCNLHRLLFLMLSFRFCKQVTADVKRLMSILSTYYIFDIYLLISLFSCQVHIALKKVLTKDEEKTRADKNSLPHRKRKLITCAVNMRCMYGNTQLHAGRTALAVTIETKLFFL